MWSVGISVSQCKEALRIGYDDQQIHRIVIRIAQYFLDKNMRVIFGHDWRPDGVMHAVAKFAGRVASRSEANSDLNDELPRMLNVVPTSREAISSDALNAERDHGGVLKVTPVDELLPKLQERFRTPEAINQENANKTEAHKLMALRHCITVLLDPGCRICLGGLTNGHHETEPGVTEEAKLALTHGKPLYLMGGFGGATRTFGEDQMHRRSLYWEADNGLSDREKAELFDTIDVEHALRLIFKGIESLRNLQH